MQSFIDGYEKKDKRNMQGALNRFTDFLIEKKKQGLLFSELTDVIITDFQDYLFARSVGEGGSSYFSRFKKMMKRAKLEKVIAVNPASDIKTKKSKSRKKDILTIEEIQLLVSTPIQSPEIRRAALFCTVTGLRWCDVKHLRWKDIKGETVTIRQEKTGVDVDIPLNDTAIKLLGVRGHGNIFDLPSSNGANKTLKKWVNRAGINKTITWHNLRHSFGTNLIFKNVDVLTVSKLLGHTSMKHTQRYVDVARQMKETATDKLNINL
jgi:site-specific recombinase XerD